MSYNDHIGSSEDLVTPYEATRAGFVEIALEKNRKASPFVEEAKALRVAASKANNPEDLIHIDGIFEALITASGLSDKSQCHLTQGDKKRAVENLIENFLTPAGEQFVEELVYRFLLTKGDSLGGMMRNLAGVIGERKFIRSLISVLSIQKKTYFWLDKRSGSWFKNSLDDAGIENDIKGISWGDNEKPRTIVLNTTIPFVGKNVDLCLLNCDLNLMSKAKKDIKDIIDSPDCYIALGELKGGIDPAGADEHWKTANTALERIRKAFQTHSQKPQTFFVAAAIENAMANEIYEQLKTKMLSNAANLTNDSQVFSLCEWLIGI